MHNLSAAFVLGYHGCDQKVGESLLSNQPFRPSSNDYDWLGGGIYFWQANPDRALQWAKEQQNRGRITAPFVVGAIIELGFCLDLVTSNGIEAVRKGYEGLQQQSKIADFTLPSNTGGKDRLVRRLDCAVINYLHKMLEKGNLKPFDTVRGLFPEGNEIYPGSGFQDKNHVQICVRNQERIHGVFRVHERYFSSL